MAHKKPIGIAVHVAVFRSGKLLLGKRRGRVGDGTWCLPGGRLEPGEHFNVGAARELGEETGLLVAAENLTLVNVTNDTTDKGHYIHFTFHAPDIFGEPAVIEPEEFEQWEWFDLRDLPEPVFFGQVKLLQALRDCVFLAD